MADRTFTGYLYVVTNTVNGKRYVGQTRLGLAARWRAHLHAAACPPRKNMPAITRAIQKYGPDAFEIAEFVKFEACTLDQLDAAETAAISALNTRVPFGYNLKPGGRAAPLHEETKRRISASNLGKRRSAEARERYRQVRLNETPEARAKRTAHMKFMKPTPEHLAKMNAIRIANGRSAETRAKIGAANTGRPQHPNTAAALLRTHLGAKRSPEARARISAGIRAARERRLLASAAEAVNA